MTGVYHDPGPSLPRRVVMTLGYGAALIMCGAAGAALGWTIGYALDRWIR